MSASYALVIIIDQISNLSFRQESALQANPNSMQLKWLLLFAFAAVCACLCFSLWHTFSVLSSCTTWRRIHLAPMAALWKPPPFTHFIHTNRHTYWAMSLQNRWYTGVTHTRRHTLHEWTASLATLLLFWSGCGGRDHTRPVVYHILYTHWVYWPTDPAWLCTCTCMCAQCIGVQ